MAVIEAAPAPAEAIVRAKFATLVTWSKTASVQAFEVTAAPMPHPTQFVGVFAQQTGPTP